MLLHPSLALQFNAREAGSVVRFVRRSCKPTAAVQPVFIHRRACLALYATAAVEAQKEITVPYDFNVADNTSIIDCGCEDKDACPVYVFRACLSLCVFVVIVSACLWLA